MELKSLVAVFLILSTAQASIILSKHAPSQFLEDSGNRTEVFNGWVDEVMANVRSAMRLGGLDVIKFDDVVIPFSKTVDGIVYYGEAGIYGGNLMGVDTIHRTGDCDLLVEANGDIILTADAGFNDGTIGASLRVSYMDKITNAIMSGTLKDLQLKLVVRARIDFEGGAIKVRVQLEELQIVHIGTISISVKGLGALLNFIIKTIVQVGGNAVKNSLASALGGVIKDLINSVLQSAAPRFPIEYFPKSAALNSNYPIPRALRYV